MEENNDSSKSTTLTLLHSWAKLKSKAKQGHHTHNKRDKKTQEKQTRHWQMETHLTQKDSKLQGIHEHHPSNSKHVKYSIQLKERIESNITSRNMHCITQISRLLFTLKAPLKNKHQQTWQASRTNNQTKNTCRSRLEGLFKVVMGLRTRCGTYG